jgi:hypothetical protein
MIFFVIAVFQILNVGKLLLFFYPLFMVGMYFNASYNLDIGQRRHDQFEMDCEKTLALNPAEDR